LVDYNSTTEALSSQPILAKVLLLQEDIYW